ncbi:flocculation protein FLO11-like [Ischnura elegans]|uniref:flocculation protein FLO11-like n=1 Tax=Ischnura elegans TaxID=197161 RepID=UPI001ED891AF|nr:flocculation protein FLO11-like [Ischnura elegans]
MCSRGGPADGVGVGGVDLRGRPQGSSPMLLFVVLAVVLLCGGSWVGGVPLKGRLGQGATPPHLPGGCVYGGSEYGEGEAVVTDEQCLNCTCSRGALVCHLRACPAPPKAPGCTAVRPPGSHACCPSIVCDEVNNTVGRAIEEMTFGTEPARNISGCDVDGQKFEEGSSIPGIAGRCEECHCSGGKVGCARTPCSPAPAGCTPLFASQEECCPSRYDCPGAPSLALLLDIDLGSNIESVLAPPSHEELMGYFGANSTEVTQGEEKGTTAAAGPSATTSPEGAAGDDAQSAAAGPRVGDLRKDRHMETSTTEERKTGQNGDQQGPAGGGSVEDAGVKAANESSSSPEDATGGEETATGEPEAETSTEVGTTTEVEAAEGSTEGGEEAETTTTTLETETEAAPASPDEATEETPTTTTTTEELTTTEVEETTTGEPVTEPTTEVESADNDTVAYYSVADEGNTTLEMEVEGETENPITDDYSAGNETAELDYEQTANVTGDADNSTAADAALDSAKNVSGVLGDEEGGAVGLGVEGSAGNATGGAAEEKTMDKMILAEAGGEEVALPSPVNCSEVELPPTTAASIERKKDMDYEEAYDYGEPTLPPSLPNLRIIPFLAEDAVDKDKHKTTEAPIFFDGVPPSLFSPPVETEGGFVPRDPPILDGGLHDVTYKSPILSDNLPSFQTEMPLTGIAAIQLTTTSKPNVQGDFGLQSLVVNGTLGSSVLDSLFSPLDQLPPDTGIHTILSPIVRPSFLDSKITPLKPMPGTLTFYNNASHYPPLPTAVPGSPIKSQTVPVTYSPLPTKIPNYNTFPSSSHKGTAASPFSGVRNTVKRPSPTMGVTPATTTSKNSVILATMTSSPSGGSPSGGQRHPLPSSDRVSVIPLGPTPPRPSPSTSAPYSVGPNLPPSMKPLTSPPVTSSTSPGSASSVPQNSPAVGLLKLAGCNIYGRMYRVGRIISELSGPCLECRCTEVGVQCRPLPC